MQNFAHKSCRTLLNIPRTKSVIHQNRFQSALILNFFIVRRNKHELICNSISSYIFARYQLGESFLRLLIDSRRLRATFTVGKVPRPARRYLIGLGTECFFLSLNHDRFFYYWSFHVGCDWWRSYWVWLILALMKNRIQNTITTFGVPKKCLTWLIKLHITSNETPNNFCFTFTTHIIVLERFGFHNVVVLQIIPVDLLVRRWIENSIVPKFFLSVNVSEKNSREY